MIIAIIIIDNNNIIIITILDKGKKSGNWLAVAGKGEVYRLLMRCVQSFLPPKPPVEPKPPSPRSVASKSSTSTISGVEIFSRMSCAILSPLATACVGGERRGALCTCVRACVRACVRWKMYDRQYWDCIHVSKHARWVGGWVQHSRKETEVVALPRVWSNNNGVHVYTSSLTPVFLLLLFFACICVRGWE